MAFLDQSTNGTVNRLTGSQPSVAQDALKKILGQLTDQSSIDRYAKKSAAIGQQEKAAIGQGIEQRNRVLQQMGKVQPPQTPDLQKLPQSPQVQLKDSISVFGSVGPWLAIFGSLLTRAPLTTAMNAAASAMKGFQQGQTEAARTSFENWKAATTEALDQNQQEIDKYNMARQKYGDNIDMLKSEISVIAADSKDKLAMASIDQGNLDAIYGPNGLIEKRAEAGGKIAESLVKIEQSLNPQSISDTAHLIADYHMAPLSAFALRSPWGQQVMAEVRELNPNYNATTYGERVKAAKDFGTGPLGNTVRSMNAVTLHLGVLKGMVQALSNGDVQAFNKLSQTWAQQTGEPAPTNFDSVKSIVGKEIVKAIIPGAGGVTEREEAQELLNRSQSPQQLYGNMNSLVAILGGQLTALKQQYKATTGQDNFDDLLIPQAKSLLENGTKSSDKTTQFINGQIYEDSQGRKAMYRDGQWIPQ